MKTILSAFLIMMISAIHAFSQDEPIPPPAPNVQFVIGDGSVTLYWDDIAEQHYDPFFEGYVVYGQEVAPGQVQNFFADPNNFQGYKVIKANDPEFLDALRITDNRGNPIDYAFEVMFDRNNEIRGYHPASVSGQRRWLGSDTGIRRVFTDTGLINGRTYYYAVISFTFGDARPEFDLPVISETGEIIDPLPSEIYKHPPLRSPMITGVNVVEVVPQKGALGYIPPEDPEIERAAGTGSGNLSLQVVDPFELRANNNYSLVFEDTLVDGLGNTRDLVTKNFSLINQTTGEILFDRVSDLTGVELPVKEGFQINVERTIQRLAPDLERSDWETSQESNIHNLQFALSSNSPSPNDYRVEFSDESLSQSVPFTIGTTQLPAENVNFRIFNNITDEELDFAYFTNPQLPRDLRDVHMFDGQTSIIVGATGLIQRSTDGGVTWEVIESGQPVRLNGLSFIDGQRGWAAGRDGVVIRTDDGGNTWSDALNTDTDVILRDIHFVDENNGWAVGDGGTVLVTTDGGDSWDTQTTNSIRRLNSVYFSDADNGWAVGLLTVLRTNDGGQTWEAVSTGVNTEFLGLYFPTAQTGWLVGLSGNIVKTTDGGDTWETQSDAAFQVLNDVYFLNESTGWAVGRNGSIIFTNDGGENWEQQNSTTTGELYAVYAFDENNVTVVGTNSIRISTSNGGQTWVQTENFRRFRAAIDDNGNSRSDIIYILEEVNVEGSLEVRDTWRVSMLARSATSEFGLTTDPIGGDVLNLLTLKPFTSADEFQFTIGANNLPTISDEISSDALKDIRVVPNPYLVTHLAEPAGSRQLHFVNVPTRATIRVFTVAGRPVKTIEVDNPPNSDRFIWDLRNDNNEEISYGVYIYHVSAPGIGETTGKFAIIK